MAHCCLQAPGSPSSPDTCPARQMDVSLEAQRRRGAGAQSAGRVQCEQACDGACTFRGQRIFKSTLAQLLTRGRQPWWCARGDEAHARGRCGPKRGGGKDPGPRRASRPEWEQERGVGRVGSSGVERGQVGRGWGWGWGVRVAGGGGRARLLLEPQRVLLEDMLPQVFDHVHVQRLGHKPGWG